MIVKQALYRTNVSNLDCEKPLREIHNMTLMSHNGKNYKILNKNNIRIVKEQTEDEVHFCSLRSGKSS